MSRYVLDTDAIIDHMFGIADSVSLIQDLFDRGDSLCLCDVVVAEVYAGLRPQHRAAAQAILSACSFLPTSFEAATKAGEWCYTYARRGIILSVTDMIVAATAHLHGAAIVTGNRDHYPMPELVVLPLPRAKR